MTNARFVFPKLRLTEIIRAPGGLSVADALAQAQANLEEIRPTCLAELESLLQLAESAAAQFGEACDLAAVESLYGIAVRGIGTGAVCGVPAVDEALTSLCDLLDHLKNGGPYQREAIAVHVGAWRLLMNIQLPPAGAAAVLDGLRQVTRRHAAGA